MQVRPKAVNADLNASMNCLVPKPVRVTGRYNNTPQVVFLRKGRGMTNITGEKVSVNQVINVIQNAAQKTGTVASHFKAEADTEKSRYVLRVEFSSAVSDDAQRQFLRQADEEMKAINIEYKAKRESMRLKARCCMS